MRRSFIISGLLLTLAIFARVTFPQQVATPPAASRGKVDVRLKLPGGEKFSGVATVRLLTGESAEVASRTEDIDAGPHFADLSAGKYVVEVTAPGFSTIRHDLEISVHQPSATVFLTMTPEVPPVPEVLVSGSPPTPILAATLTSKAEESVHALLNDDAAPAVLPDVACPLPLVLKGVGQRAEELVNNLDRFSATERVEHFTARAGGGLGVPEARSFDYVVVVTRTDDGVFLIDEYRDGDLDPRRFPAGIATTGLPALALIFHPRFAPEFNFVCEGLGELAGKPAWQVRFEQRTDRPNQIRSYRVNRYAYSVLLKGRVMIDAGTFQVLRLQSELLNPVPQIKLTQERISIEYTLVQFHTDEQQLWLPKSAELYVERGREHYYRLLTFSNFQVFTVGMEQKVHAPKESYAFTNTSDYEISGILTVTPIPGRAIHPMSITFRIPARSTVYKVVGPGKDIDFPVESVESARFAYTGPTGSIDANAYLVHASTLELVPDTVIPADLAN